ncbi:MAG TPA: metallophosphoesterase [Gaiellaceae bacterium]|nr:metallophosphoesterase [Gaiellaceae bacterium]
MADTHMPRGTRRLPGDCLGRLKEADVIFHAGDFVSATVLEELGRLGPVEAVVGNMDEPALRAVLPTRRVVDVEGARIGMVHVAGPAVGRGERLVAAFPDCDAVVYGHTHVADVSRTGDVWVLNPGSPTERRSAPVHSMLMLAIDSGEIRPELVTLSP